MAVWYATEEDVRRALDVAETARFAGQVGRAIDSGSRSVEGTLRRRFYPQIATKFFPWPNRQYARPWRLWLDADEVISVTVFTAGGVAIPDTDFFLEPANSGPPFNRVEIDLGSAAAFGGGDTHQRNIAITGLWGYRADSEPAGALAAPVDDSTTTVDVTDSAAVGVGSILLVEAEYAIVGAKRMLDTGQNLGGNLTDQKSDVSVAVTDGTAYAVDEVILVDAERMLIVDIAGNTLVVRRGFDGSVLAGHTAGADIFAPRRLTVERGALGSTAVAHLIATAVRRHVVPGLVRELTIAEAINTLEQERSGYARTAGAGENERLVGGRGLIDIRTEAVTRYGRRARSRAV